MTDPATILLPASKASRAVPITLVTAGKWPAAAGSLDAAERSWLKAVGFAAEAGQHAVVPGNGGLSQVFFALGNGSRPADPFALGKLARALPDALYRLEGE